LPKALAESWQDPCKIRCPAVVRPGPPRPRSSLGPGKGRSGLSAQPQHPVWAHELKGSGWENRVCLTRKADAEDMRCQFCFVPCLAERT
jgi:hypothetical protein